MLPCFNCVCVSSHHDYLTMQRLHHEASFAKEQLPDVQDRGEAAQSDGELVVRARAHRRGGPAEGHRD